MIIEDSGEQQNSQTGRTFIGDALAYRNVPYKRDEIKIGTVRTGDYTNENGDFLVERKRADDFVGSVLDGRIFEQLAKMHDNFEGYKELIFIGDWELTIEKCYADDQRRGDGRCTAAFVQSAQLVLQQMGVQWWVACDETEAAKRIIYLDKYAKGSNKFELKHKKQKHFGIDDERIKTFLNMPHIASRKTAEMLLEIFKTPYEFIKLCIENPKECKDILKGKRVGINTIEKVAKIFNSKEKVNFHESGSSEDSDSTEGSDVLPEGQKKTSGHRNFYRRGQNH